MDWIIRNLIVNKRNVYIIYGIVLVLFLVNYIIDGYQTVVLPLIGLIILSLLELSFFWYKRVFRKNQSIFENIMHLSETGKHAEIIEQACLIKIIEQHILLKKYYIATANIYLNNPQEALHIYDSIESEYPSSGGFLYHKGVALSETGDNIKAVEYLTRAIGVKKCWQVYDQRGIAYMKIDKYEEAEKDLRESVELKEESVNTCNLGIFLNKKGEYEEAMKLYNKSIEIQCENPVAFYNRALLRQKISDYELAIEDFDSALKSGCDNKYLFLNRGYCKCKLGDVTGGMIDLSMALDMGCEEAKELIEEYSGE